MHHFLRYRYCSDVVHREYRSLGPIINLNLDDFQLRYESQPDPQIGLSSYNMNIANTAMYCAITFIAQGILVCPCTVEGSVFDW